MKRGLLGFPLLIFLTQVISAQFFSGYGRFSITDFFNRIDPSTIILTLLFLIFFALIFYALSRFFKDPYGQPNKGIAGVIAFAASSLIIYGLYVTNLSFNLGNVFYDLGFSSDTLYPILTLLFLVVAGLLIWKLKFSGFLMTFGLFMILLTMFTNIFYEKIIPLIMGFVLLGIGFWLWRRRRRRGGGRRKRPPREPRPRKPRPGREPRPRKPRPSEADEGEKAAPGEASLDVIAGGRNLGGTGNVTLDLTRNNSTIIYIKNGGTGGTLGWRASSHRTLGLSRNRGRLRIGQTYALTVTVRDRGGRQNPAVIITGRGAGRTGGRATRGRVLIYFRVR